MITWFCTVVEFQREGSVSNWPVYFLDFNTRRNSPVCSRHGKHQKFYLSRILHFQILPESAWITPIWQSQQKKQRKLTVIKIFPTFTGWVTWPSLSKYKNIYTFKAYKRLFIPFAILKNAYVKAKFILESTKTRRGRPRW